MAKTNHPAEHGINFSVIKAADASRAQVVSGRLTFPRSKVSPATLRRSGENSRIHRQSNCYFRVGQPPLVVGAAIANNGRMARSALRLQKPPVGGLAILLLSLQQSLAYAALDWRQLPPLPNPAGLGAPYAGVSQGKLLVAGGASFPQRPPWEGGEKVWFDTVYALAEGSADWKEAGKLFRPMAYGVSVTARVGVVCAGGCDAQRHYRDVFVLEWTNGRAHLKPLPPLPRTMANGAGAILNHTLYVAGGIETPSATKALRTFWALDLALGNPDWRELEPWPGPARMLGGAGAQNGAFFLVSGADLSADAEGKPVRHYLRDAYRYRPGAGWTQLADAPRAAVAAPSPAPSFGAEEFLVLSGDDGTKLGFQPPNLHPGFAKDVLAYHTAAGTWNKVGEVSVTQVTVPAVLWSGRYVLPNGEIRPGVRTPQVWSFGANST